VIAAKRIRPIGCQGQALTDLVYIEVRFLVVVRAMPAENCCGYGPPDIVFLLRRNILDRLAGSGCALVDRIRLIP